MVTFIKYNLKSKYTLATFLIISVAVFLNSLSYLTNNMGIDVKRFNPFIFMFLGTHSSIHWYFWRLFPVFVSLPGALMFFEDNKNGTNQILISKIGQRQYYLKRMLSIFISTFIVYCVPLIIECLILGIIFYPQFSNGGPDYMSIYSKQSIINNSSLPLVQLFNTNIFLHYFISIFWFSTIASLVNLFSASFSVYRFKYGLLYLLPSYLVLIIIQLVFNNAIYVTTFLLSYNDLRRNWHLSGFIILFLVTITLINIIKMLKSNKVLTYDE